MALSAPPVGKASGLHRNSREARGETMAREQEPPMPQVTLPAPRSALRVLDWATPARGGLSWAGVLVLEVAVRVPGLRPRPAPRPPLCSRAGPQRGPSSRATEVSAAPALGPTVSLKPGKMHPTEFRPWTLGRCHPLRAACCLRSIPALGGPPLFLSKP